MSVKKGDIAEAIAANSGGEQFQGPKPTGGMQGTRDTLTIGANYVVRTVTIACIGKLVGISHLGANTFLHFDHYTWVADFGDFKQSLKTGKLQKADTLPGVILVAVAPIVDIHAWDHPLKAYA